MHDRSIPGSAVSLVLIDGERDYAIVSAPGGDSGSAGPSGSVTLEATERAARRVGKERIQDRPDAELLHPYRVAETEERSARPDPSPQQNSNNRPGRRNSDGR